MLTMNRKVFLFALVCFACILSSCWCCPKECSCKWKNGKITAECSERGFISIPMGIENETQVLDISGNDLQELHRDTFKNFGLVSLQKMFMRSCRLGRIDKNAFRGLENLLEIDLSSNLLTYVPSQAFADIHYLRNISLANNPIQKIEAFAFSLVPQLGKLDLSHCKIQSIRPNAFDRLDGLDHLKLNDNELHDLPVDTVEKLSKLRTIELHGNNWTCDCHMRGVKIWISDSGVHTPEALFCSGGPERLKDMSILSLDADDFACRPSIRTDVRHLEPSVGFNLTIECRVESDPPAKINWFFEKVQLSNNSIYDGEQRLLIIESEDNLLEKRSTLVLQRVEESDAGEYHCVADNRAGSAEANFTLHPRLTATGIVALSSSININVITVALGLLIVLMLLVIVWLVKKITYSSYPGDDDDDDPKKGQPEKNSMETSSQKSHDSEIKSDSGKAFTVTSDLSYSRSLSDIGNPQFSNPDLISGTNMRRDSTCITPLPITRPISDYCHNWQKSYAMPRAASSSGFNYDIHDRMPMVVDTVSAAGSGSDEVFVGAHSRMSNDYPPDYGLPILPENGIGGGVSPPCAKTLKVWQRGVPVFPPMCTGQPPMLPPNYHVPPPMRNSPAERSPYQRCGTDV